MSIKIVDTVLPTTMVGSYPRPHWFTQQLLGRDVRVAFKEVSHEEAYHDATASVIRDQEEAGLDIVTDGQMSYDDYVGVIGSFCWYMYERIGGFDPSREDHPAEAGVESRDRTTELLHDWGGVINSGPVTHGPIRLVDLYKIAKQYTDKPIKVSVGAGPVNLAWHVYFQHYKDPQELCYALAPIFNAEMKGLVEAGATYLQLEDLGAWLPLFTGDEKDYKWIRDVIGKCCEGVDAKIGWHFCFGNAWGNDILSAQLPGGLPDRPAALLRHAGHRPVRARLREPRHERDRVPREPSRGQGRPGGRAGHPDDDGRVAGAGRRPRPQGARARSCRPRHPVDGLRHEATAADDREDEAEGARRGRRDRAGRAVGRHRAWGGALSRARTPRACIEGCEGGMRGHGCRRPQDAACAGGSANSSPFVHHVSSA